MKARPAVGAILLILALLLAAPLAVAAQPSLPHYFHGTLKINGAPAPAGATVEARGAGVLNGSFNPITTTLAGKYGDADPLAITTRLLVQGNIADGVTIEFFVNGAKANETALWHSGQITVLNLTVGATPPPPPADTLAPSVALTPLTPDPATSSTVTLTGAATDTQSNIALVEYRVDAGAWSAATPADGAFNGLSESFTLTVTGLANGDHTVWARAADAAGNVTPQARWASDSFTVAAPSSPPGGGGGGGGGGGAAPPATTVSTSGLSGDTELKVDSSGKSQNAVKLSSSGPGGPSSIAIPAGTVMKTATGAALASITMAAPASTPPAPPQSAVVVTQDLGPNGATFDPPITLTMSFDPAALPPGAARGDLAIAFWDGANWVNLETTLDEAAHTLSAKVSHFTVFGILAKTPAAAPSPAPQAPTPAQPPAPPAAPAPAAPPTTAPMPAPQPEGPPATNWPLITSLVAAIALAGALVVLIRRRAARQ